MKKTLSVLIAALLALLAFAGCGSGTQLSHGVWEGNTFSNESTGIKITADDSWTISSDDDLASLMNITVDKITDGESNIFQEYVLKLQTIYDAMVTTPNGSSIVVMYENLAYSASTGLTEEEYLDVLKDNLPSQLSGLECNFGDYSKQEIGSNTYTLLKAEITDYALEQYYFVRKLDNYMSVIIVTTYGSDSIDDLLSAFVS